MLEVIQIETLDLDQIHLSGGLHPPSAPVLQMSCVLNSNIMHLADKEYSLYYLDNADNYEAALN